MNDRVAPSNSLVVMLFKLSAKPSSLNLNRETWRHFEETSINSLRIDWFIRFRKLRHLKLFFLSRLESLSFSEMWKCSHQLWNVHGLFWLRASRNFYIAYPRNSLKIHDYGIKIFASDWKVVSAFSNILIKFFSTPLVNALDPSLDIQDVVCESPSNSNVERKPEDFLSVKTEKRYKRKVNLMSRSERADFSLEIEFSCQRFPSDGNTL